MNVFNGMTLNPPPKLYHASKSLSESEYLHANDHYLIHTSDAVPPAVASLAQRHHPRQVYYQVPGLHRALAHLLANPSLSATGFAALALYGMRYLTDYADTFLTGPTIAKKTSGSSLTPALFRSEPKEIWQLNYVGLTLQAAPPAVALCQALTQVRSGEVRWPIVKVSGLSEEFVRAVQLVDAARHFINVDPVDLLRASRQRISLPWLVDVLMASSPLAESPKETEMRLLALEVARSFQLELREQLLLTDAHGKPITRFDLALPQLKIGLMYDGAHHWEHERRHKDTAINLESAVMGWQVLRFSAATLWGLVDKLTQIVAQRV
ncbi:hypothetical protein [Corynebacterium sp. HMSC29G08]|uniref:hypothetical protein n=1 Tax=Corynebacterium sp. HMSC29G08 TaxID=1581069 RepID=UPI0008A4FC15|nr:hypothetical protein [Corynebacterium sp. HMSC29G08]OFT82038.1 hypothetical protein HMPREF3101_08810 [Corynebacterium sp. HMSC29G08]